jgi:CAAX protease family protein
MPIQALNAPTSWPSTLGLAVGWLALMLAYSPLADRIATRFVATPPALGAFRMLQQSRSRLFLGIVMAWLLGGFLEELIFRGIVLQWLKGLLSGWLDPPIAAALAVCFAAIGAGLVHLYQGLRAAIIVAQLSALFGMLFVVDGYNLWAVVFCHGMYDTVAFIRFANKKSKYSQLDG